MHARRLWLLVPALVFVAGPVDVDAQGRGPKAKSRNGNGPAFCRSGAGHPVHGWQWCREKGWDRADRDWGWWDRDDDRRDDRDRDDRGRRSRTSRYPWPF
ncbi:MAG: hypothetical protein HYY76_19975 [Acidobacteria bacterium]|nr:hypothetical protein [Acidobacteriota bacterium]